MKIWIQIVGHSLIDAESVQSVADSDCRIHKPEFFIQKQYELFPSEENVRMLT